jgi:hypothetical protein
MNQPQHRLMQVLQKISVFKGLELGHIQRLLRVGTSQTYGIGERVYSIGEPSDVMLVLLQGKMLVTSAGGSRAGYAYGGNGCFYQPAAFGEYIVRRSFGRGRLPREMHYCPFWPQTKSFMFAF